MKFEAPVRGFCIQLSVRQLNAKSSYRCLKFHILESFCLFRQQECALFNECEILLLVLPLFICLCFFFVFNSLFIPIACFYFQKRTLTLNIGLHVEEAKFLMITDYKIILLHPWNCTSFGNWTSKPWKHYILFFWGEYILSFSFTYLIKRSSLSFHKCHKFIVLSEYGVTSCTLEAAHDILRTSKQLLLCLVGNRRATKVSQMISLVQAD